MTHFFREEADRQWQEERRKKREKEEYQREKMRENIRQKYGIQKKTKDKKGKDPAHVIEVSGWEDGLKLGIIAFTYTFIKTFHIKLN